MASVLTVGLGDVSNGGSAGIAVGVVLVIVVVLILLAVVVTVLLLRRRKPPPLPSAGSAPGADDHPSA